MFTATITVANAKAANAVMAAICVVVGGNANATGAVLG